MSIFQKVTLEILKKNKVRTIVTIIGVILSAAMITAVTTSVSSFQNYLLENAIYSSGDWHASILEAEETAFETLASSGKVASYVYNEEIGYAVAEGCVNVYKPYLYVIGAKKDFMERMPIHLTGGRLPQAAEEILLPEHLASNGEVFYKVGDELVLELGDRVSEGYRLGQNNPYAGAEEETLQGKETRTFTVVGFYERPDFEDFSSPGYTAITIMDKETSADTRYNIYYKLKNPNEVYTFFSSHEYGGTTNTNVLTYLGVTKYNGFSMVLYGLAGIVIGLIMFSSVALIYNAFSISVSERTKQFGLLSSIGATKKQIRNMVLFEGMVVSGIGIPLGIFTGVGGMGVTFALIGKKFSEVTNYKLPLSLFVYPWTIAAACVITFLTVMISAWIPSKRATRVTAVEAIRQSHDIKIKTKKFHKNGSESGFFGSNRMKEKILYRSFGVSGMIADKYYRRSKKKYRATIVSLFMSIVLFVSASAFTQYFTNMVEAGYEGDNYDIRYYYDPTEYISQEEYDNGDFSHAMSQEDLAKLLAGAEEVTELAYAKNVKTSIAMETAYISEEYLAYRKELENVTGVKPEKVDMEICFIDDSTYAAFLEEKGLEKALYLNPETNVGIVFDGKSEFDYDLEKIVTTNVLKKEGITLTAEKEEQKITVEVGKILYERPYFVSNYYELAIVYPYSKCNKILQNVQATEYYIKSTDHKTSVTSIKNRLTEQGLFTARNIYDKAAEMERNRSLILVIHVFAYGFIILISLIAAANIFNTISTNIHLRRREFAMLKSVGMSNKELNHMMNFECILYGSRALFYGIPAAVVVTWLIYRVISNGYRTNFSLPWGAIGIAVCSVFFLVFLTMMYAMKKIKADNPIDALKNDNL